MAREIGAEWWDDFCASFRSIPDLVTVEFMPAYLRESHRAARNWGRYPSNGAIRQTVTREEAERIVASDPDGYAAIVSDDA